VDSDGDKIVEKVSLGVVDDVRAVEKLLLDLRDKGNGGQR
jgi:hypothetical protein